VQQVLIARQQPIREFFPLTGDAQLGAHALQTALLAPGARVILCGGEERGTWLREHGSASEETFAFAVGLGRDSVGEIGRIGLKADPKASEASATQGIRSGWTGERGNLDLRELFELIRDRKALQRALIIGGSLEVSWL
jgi:hypothetical protein